MASGRISYFITRKKIVMLKVIDKAGIESAGKMDKDRWVFFKGSIRIEIERKAEDDYVITIDDNARHLNGENIVVERHYW